MSLHRRNLGRAGEELAVDYLNRTGYRIVTRNYREKCGEIDIIARDGRTYVFIEVKTRQSKRFGHPLEAVTEHKQRQIGKTAMLYLSRQALLDEPARFDVIGVDLGCGEPEIVHLRGAFEAG